MAERKRFTHLSKIEIRDIVSSFYNGETKLSIASRLNIDHSTVHYHIKRFDKAYLENPSVYALLKQDFRKTCLHPSMRCSLCNTYQDNLADQHKQTIKDLTHKLKVATERLESVGLHLEPSHTKPSKPLVSFTVD